MDEIVNLMAGDADSRVHKRKSCRQDTGLQFTLCDMYHDVESAIYYGRHQKHYGQGG